MTHRDIIDLYVKKLPCAFLECAIMHCNLNIYTCIKFSAVNSVDDKTIDNAFAQYRPNEGHLRECIQQYKAGLAHNEYMRSFGRDSVDDLVDVDSLYRRLHNLSAPYKILLKNYYHGNGDLSGVVIDLLLNPRKVLM